ncbi:MAG: type II toxin-antitoxin system HipA family toxin [Pseudomonadota bacterium]|nr:type II toxin-antitoxin system HipA family toxin [Pseudomonadota bacterium]
MKKLLVYYEGWGERWLLGTLADNGQDLLFEYAPEALANGLELSPRHLKLRREAYAGFPAHMHRLPGLIADCLPDGWGLLLMDRLFRRNGRSVASVSPLDRLAFIGRRAMGALSFEPAEHLVLPREDVALLELAKEVRTVIAGKDGEALRELAVIGGSPHGARPKVLINYNSRTGLVSTGPLEGGEPWLVKFQAQDEHKEVCAVEQVYAELARQCGMEVPATRHFDLDRKLAGFGIARFDVKNGMRVPVHTLAGVLHANFRIPSSVDYTTFLRATRMLTRDEREVRKAYERAVFNVLFNNRDDHCKNFSFRLEASRHWRLAPCYDLTFNEGAGGEHQMDVCGFGKDITRASLLTLANQGGLEAAWASETLDRMLESAGAFTRLADGAEIRKSTIKHIAAAIESNRVILVSG